MTKDQRTAAQLEAMILVQVARTLECPGTIGVVVEHLDDPRVETNWVVAFRNDLGANCEMALIKVVADLQQHFDLEKPLRRP